VGNYLDGMVSMFLDQFRRPARDLLHKDTFYHRFFYIRYGVNFAAEKWSGKVSSCWARFILAPAAAPSQKHFPGSLNGLKKW
jgi:hypothetical protein